MVREKESDEEKRGGSQEGGLPCDHTSVGAVSREGRVASYFRYGAALWAVRIDRYSALTSSSKLTSVFRPVCD